MNGWSAFSFKSSALRLAVCACVALAVVLLVSARRAPVSAQRAKTAHAPVTCATCHAGIVNDFAHAPMRHAIEPEGANPILSTHPDLKLTQNGYSYSVQTKDGKSTYTVTDGKETITLPMRWFFGTYNQTWVLEKDGKYYESMVSYFRRPNGLATTPGDQHITPHTLTEAMGRALPLWETRECFDCHGSGVKAGEPLVPDKVKPGLDCEHCHAGAEQHMADAQKGDFKTQPVSLKKLDAESVSTFCGQCHRSFDIVLRNGWHGPAFVRFQPYRLALSRCFSGNDPRISCLACHDPHQTVSHDAASYDAKCLACHDAAAHRVASTAAVAVPPVPAIKTCPVAKKDCVTCHMPKVDLPGGNQQFTDHFIRVVKPGAAYPY